MLKYLATAGVNNNAISEIAPMSLASTSQPAYWELFSRIRVDNCIKSHGSYYSITHVNVY